MFATSPRVRRRHCFQCSFTAASQSPARRRPVIQTYAPSLSGTRFAVARPTPLSPLVISVILPFSFPIHSSHQKSSSDREKHECQGVLAHKLSDLRRVATRTRARNNGCARRLDLKILIFEPIRRISSAAAGPPADVTKMGRRSQLHLTETSAFIRSIRLAY